MLCVAAVPTVGQGARGSRAYQGCCAEVPEGCQVWVQCSYTNVSHLVSIIALEQQRNFVSSNTSYRYWLPWLCCSTLRQSSLVNGELSSSGASSPALGQGKGRKANGSGNSLLSAPHQLTIANDNRGNGSLLCRRGVSDDSSPAGSVYSSPQASPPPPAYKHIATLASPISECNFCSVCTRCK